MIYDLYRYVYNKKRINISKMKFIFVLVIMLILNISLFNYLINKRREDSYLNTGKKWDRIVKELRTRK